MLFFETIVQHFKIKINNTRPIDLFFSALLGVLAVYGLITTFISSINFPLNSDSVEVGIASMEIWRHHNFLLNQFYLPSADPLYFSEIFTFQLIPQIISNFSPFVLKIVSFFIFILALTVFGYIVYIISRRVICSLVFFALMVNLSPGSYSFFNGPTNHIATIFFIGLLFVFLFYTDKDKLIFPVVSLVILNLIIYSDSLIILWFFIPFLCLKIFNYKHLGKNDILFLSICVISSGVTYIYKTYFNPNLLVGYTQLVLVNSFDNLLQNIKLYLLKILCLFSENKCIGSQMPTLADIVLIMALIILLLLLVFNINKRKLTVFHIFTIFTGLIISFSYFFTSISNIPTLRYLSFLIVLFFAIMAIECKDNRLILGFIIILITINAFSNMSVFSEINQNSDQGSMELIKFLKDNQLYTGYGDYWDSNIVTYLSNEEVTIRQITVYKGKITPYLWVSSKRWYGPEYQGTFIISKKSGSTIPWQELDYYTSIHKPEKILTFGDKIIYFYKDPILIEDGVNN